MRALVNAKKLLGLVQGIGLLWAGCCAAAENPALVLSANIPARVPRFSVVSADLALRNNGDKQELIANFPVASELIVELKKGGTGQTIYLGPAILPDRTVKEIFRRPVTLRPGEASRFRVPLACRWTSDGKLLGAMFEEAGVYTLVFKYPVQRQENGNVSQGLVTSLPVPIEVTELDAAQATVVDRIRRLSRAAAVLDPEGGLRDVNRSEQLAMAAELRNLLKDAPSSPWTMLLKFTLVHILKDQAFNPGTPVNRAMLEEAAGYVKQLPDAADFPYAHRVAGLQKYLTRMLQTGTVTNPGDALLPAQLQVSSEAAQNISRGLQKLGDALRSGNAEQFSQLLADDFLMNDRVDRSQAATELSADHARLGGITPEISVELLSAEPAGADYSVQIRIRIKAGDRTQTQEVRLQGLFGENQVQLKRWNRVTSQGGASSK